MTRAKTLGDIERAHEARRVRCRANHRATLPADLFGEEG